MAVFVQDVSVDSTTVWIEVEDLYNPQQVTVHVVVPGGTTVDYSLEAAVKTNSSTIVADEIVTFSDMENETATKIIPVIGAFRFFRIVVNSISGGTIKLFMAQPGREFGTSTEVDA